MNCTICKCDWKVIFKERILNKYSISYYLCPNCGLLQTEQPFWLDEAYNSPIANTDTGLLQRNLLNSKILAGLLYFIFGKEATYLDIAGGYGVLTRLMRDIGFDFYWMDKYCENLLAKGFEENKSASPFASVTAFEVLEHIYDPMAFLRETFSNFKTNTIIFSTELFKGIPPGPTEWWYYSFHSGHHISFYQESTLNFIAHELKLNFYTHGNFHMITDIPLKPWTFRILTSHRANSLLLKYIRKNMKSKTSLDSQKLSRYGPN